MTAVAPAPAAGVADRVRAIDWRAAESMLDAQGFAPFGVVVEGMNAVAELEAKFADRPDQKRIEQEGNAYLIREFPGMSAITRATISR